MIPLGILGTLSGGAAAGAYELISTTVLGADTASVTFSSIDQTYKHLQIRVVSKTSVSASAQNIQLQFNGSATGYSYHWLYGNGTNVTSEGVGSLTVANLGYLAQGSGGVSVAGGFGAGVIDILDYAATTKNTTVRSFGGTTPGTYATLTSNLWNNTAAVTSILLKPESTSNFKSGSRFSLYGIK